MTTKSPGRSGVLLALAATAILTGCATHTASAPPAIAEEAEPLPADVKPLTVEQEELVRDAAG